jgi:dihydrofolate reductase
MASIRGYIAASLDGYIASADGGVDWLGPFNAVDFGYERFLGEISTVVLGRKTFDQVRTFDPGWVYAGKRAVVVTSRAIDDPPENVTAWTEGISTLVPYLLALNDGGVWIVGGAQLQSALFDLGAMDRLELFVIPVLLGNGIPLFSGLKRSRYLSLNAVERFERGVVRLDYGMADPA